MISCEIAIRGSSEVRTVSRFLALAVIKHRGGNPLTWEVVLALGMSERFFASARNCKTPLWAVAAEQFSFLDGVMGNSKTWSDTKDSEN